MEAFDQHERQQWSGKARAYDNSFAKLCARTAGDLLDAVAAGPGSRLLDVGTGPGPVASLACARKAIVTAVDAEPAMIELARERAPGADLRLAILPDLPFPDDVFDAVVGNFVINHVGDPAAAIAALARVTRPGGKVAVTIWPNPQGTAQSLWSRAIDAAGAERPPSMPRVAEYLEFARTPDGLTRLLQRGGLEDVACRRLSFVHHTDPEEWWSGVAAGVGAAGYVISRQTPAMVARIKHHFDQISAEYLDATGQLALPTEALLASGSAS